MRRYGESGSSNLILFYFYLFVCFVLFCFVLFFGPLCQECVCMQYKYPTGILVSH